MASIDIIIPNFNYGIYLKSAVESVTKQTFRNVRVLIMDNASGDNSVEIARELACKDTRIEVLARKRNIGLAASLNEGNEWAEADFVLCLSADDLLPPGALSRAVSILNANQDTAAAFGRCLFFCDGEDPPFQAMPRRTVKWRVVPGQRFIRKTMLGHMITLSPLVRTAVQKQAGDYRGNAPMLDAEMWWRWARFGEIAWTNAPQAIQRRHGQNLSNDFWSSPLNRFEKAAETVGVFFAHEGRQLENAGRLHRTVIRAIGKDAYWSAWSHLSRRDAETALTLFRLAFRYCPAARFLPPFDHLFRYADLAPRLQKALSGLIPSSPAWR